MNIQTVMTPRLSAIAEEVPSGAVIADVGTDHGYIPIYLCLNQRIQRALAMDLRPGPLSRAEKNIACFGLADRIKTRLSDGLAALEPGEADTAVVAGMGGLLIAEILGKSPVRLKRYILQPMTAAAELRVYLAQHGYTILRERLAQEENKIYTVMTVEHGQMKIQAPVYEQIGQSLLQERDPLAPALLESLINKYSAALQGIKRSGRAEMQEKEQSFFRILCELQRLKEECEKW